MDNKQARKTGRTIMVCGCVLIVLTNTSSSAVGEELWDFVNDTTVRLPESCPIEN